MSNGLVNSAHGSFRWWSIANERRQRLIVKKHKGGGLSEIQERELVLLQKVAEEIMSFDSWEILWRRLQRAKDQSSDCK